MSSVEDYMLPCLNKKLFGFECLGCGLQRSLVLLWHGEFVSAFFMYPAIYTLIPLFLLIGINLFYSSKRLNKIINSLAILSVSIILFNFILKFLN
ncbi:hypothetical protein C1T31_12115 [Hanstruepera neustonica]|uniref:DUF2752 domain-containing protein n=1 Tax=Hanstruepera neustonica TaxID=1445657 RepID=A0A2K1DWA2_9FLAO|nr:DUF2752 domain-containing protein [Hanstruepera neustonica]PNQ72293.1 hypothetical protein C1T31_12115 [Hanstruepera neustonica]